jgi:short-subunit dehydrogenase
MQLKGKIAVVTGASSGIGAETAFLLAMRGAIPILLARNVEKLEEVSRHIAGEHLYYPLDVSDGQAVQRAFAHIEQTYGRVDILVNNAGFGEFKPFVETSVTAFAEMMNVNYMGIVQCTHAALPGMLARKSGHIVNVASVAGKIATKKTTAYSASKHAVIGLSNALRLELKGTGVHLSTINPGPIATNFFDRADPHGDYMKNLAKLKGVVLQPQQVAEQIARAIEREIDEITLPWFAAAGVRLAGMFPRFFERVTLSLLDKK